MADHQFPAAGGSGDITAPAEAWDIPDAVRQFYSSLDAGRWGDLFDTLHPGWWVAVPDRRAPEAAARLVLRSEHGIRNYFEGALLAPAVHRIDVAGTDGTTALVLGTLLANGSPAETFAASVSMSDDNMRIRGYLEFRCMPAIDPLESDLPSTGAETHGDADVLAAYFGALEAGDLDRAAGCFAQDVTVSYPAARGGGSELRPRITYRTREELRAAFERRGHQALRHHITTSVRQGAHALAQGYVDQQDDGMITTFLASYSLDHEGAISRYVPLISRSRQVYASPGSR